MNKFRNINYAINRVERQKNENGRVIRKNVGRPRKPNMKAITVRMDKVLHKKLRLFAEKENIGISVIIAQAIRPLVDS